MMKNKKNYFIKWRSAFCLPDFFPSAYPIPLPEAQKYRLQLLIVLINALQGGKHRAEKNIIIKTEKG